MSVISGSAINKLFLKLYDGSAFVVHDHVAAAVVSTDVIVAAAVVSTDVIVAVAVVSTDVIVAAAAVSTDVIVAVAVSSIVIVHEFIPEKGVPSFECR